MDEIKKEEADRVVLSIIREGYTNTAYKILRREKSIMQLNEIIKQKEIEINASVELIVVLQEQFPEVRFLIDKVREKIEKRKSSKINNTNSCA